MADQEACSRIEQRSVIKFLVAEECKPVEIHRRMSTVYGATCFSRKNVCKWAKLFKEGRSSVEDEDRPGRPTEVRSPEVIESVNDLIQSDRRVTVDDIARTLSLSVGTAHKIVHDDLGYSKVSCRWVPRMLTAEHKQRRVEMSQQCLSRYEKDGDEFLKKGFVKCQHYSSLRMPRKVVKKNTAEKEEKQQKETVEEEDKKKAPAKGWGRKKKLEPDDDNGEDTGEPKPKLKARASIVDSLTGIDFSAKAKTKDGKVANFKIASWNVNGLRAWLEKDGLSYIKAENPDVACVQELKCDVSKIPAEAKLDGYTNYWLSGDKEGYSGVGLYYRTQPISITEGIGIKNHDEEGRVITAEFDKFFLVNTYIPNSGRGLPRLDYRTKEWDVDFRNYLKSLDKKKPVVWCGDLNVAHHEIDLRNPKGNKKTAGFTIEERESFTATLREGFIDSFRYLYPHKEDAYTFWTHMMNARAKNAGWRLDYFVLSERLKENLCDNIIRSSVLGSDHCPIVLQLAL